jgi:hypothetical protein
MIEASEMLLVSLGAFPVFTEQRDQQRGLLAVYGDVNNGIIVLCCSSTG